MTTRAKDQMRLMASEASEIARSLAHHPDQRLKRLAEMICELALEAASQAHHVSKVQDDLRFRSVTIEEDPDETPTKPERIA